MAEATWCGQCYLDFTPRPRERMPVPPAPPRPDVVEQQRDASFEREWIAPPAEGPEDPAPVGWPCPSCSYSNQLSLNACEICGTPFAKLFEQPSSGRSVDPTRAAIASLFLPGLGHIRAGRVGEGIARLVIFAWAFGMGLMLSLPLAALCFIAAGALSILSATDAFRVASGQAQILKPRVLFYASIGLAALSLISILVLVFRTARVHP